MGKDEGKARRRVRLVFVMQHKMSEKKNKTKQKSVARPLELARHFAQIVVDESYTFARLMSTAFLKYLPSL